MTFSAKAAVIIAFWSAVLLVQMTASPANAQERADYALRHFTDENGLPQNSVCVIRQGPDGFIWLTTEDGLTRFDGNNFYVYNRENTGVTSNRFLAIYEDLHSRKLYAYNLNHERVFIRDGKVQRDTVTVPEARREPVALRTVPLPASVRAEITANSSGIPAAPGFYYLFTDRHIFFVHGDKCLWKRSRPSPGEKYTWMAPGHVLYGLDRKGAFFRIDSNRTWPVSLIGDLADGQDRETPLRVLSHPSARHILLQKGQNLYLAQVLGERMATKQLVAGFDFEGNKIRAAFYDSATGNLFLGSATNGLYMLTRKNFRTRVPASVGQDWGNSFYAQAVHGNGVLLPQHFEIQAGHAFKRVLGAPGTIYNQYAMLKDKRGYLWMSAHNQLLRFDAELKPAGSWTAPGEPVVFHEGSEHHLWIGTREGHVLHMDLQKLRGPDLLPVSVPRVSYLLQDGEDRLWLASYNGLYCLHLASGRIDTVKELNNEYVRSLYADRPGRLWITTYEKGIFLYARGRLVHFPPDDEHFLAAAHCIVEDRKGYFWITTNKGLFHVAKNDLLAYANGLRSDVFYLYYNKASGFNTNEFNGGCQPCAVELPDGTLSLPTLNGLVWFNPQSLREELPDKELFIDRVELNGKPVPDPEVKPLHLRQYTDRLAVWVSSPYFGDRRNVQIHYALTSSDRPLSFIRLQAGGAILVQNLSPGTYTLHIRKTNGFGSNNYTMKKITIVVPPFWYQTIWFFMGLLLLLAGLVYLFINIRTRYLLRKNRLLEVVVHKRTLKLEQALRSLKTAQETQAKQSYIQERLVAAISHDIRTPLKYLSYSNRRIYEQLLLSAHDDGLLETSRNAAESASRMHLYLGNLIQYVKTSLGKGDITEDSFNLHELIREHISLFADSAYNNGTTIINKVPAGQMLRSNRQLLAIILNNVIDNSVKNTLNGEISICVEKVGSMLVVVIADNGTGISAELREWVNRPAGSSFDKADLANEMKLSPGMGLFIIKELSLLIRAGLQISSNGYNGTEVRISLKQGL